MKLYAEAIFKRNILHIVERPKKVGPLLIDIDFKFSKEHKERQYTDDDIKYLVSNINQVIMKYFKVSSEMINAFIFEKESPSVKNDEYKDGFHIVYPLMAFTAEMRYLILNDVKNNIKDKSGFKHIPFKNSLDDVFDFSIVTRNGWMMYGSKKHTGQYYLLEKIYNVSLQMEDISKWKKKKDIPHILSNRKYNEGDECDFKDNLNLDDVNNKIKKIVSTYEKNKINKNEDLEKEGPSHAQDADEDIFEEGDENSNDDPDEENEIKMEYNKIRADHNYDYVAPKSKKISDTEMAKQLTSILSKQRATDYHTWISVGWALHNVDDSLLDTWKEFSKKCPKKYNAKYCDEIWEKARSDGFKMASLHMWAREDNLQAYGKLMRESINELFREAENGTEHDISKIIFELYKHIFKCTSIKHNVWYEFQKHRWVEVEEGYTLSEKISEDLTKEFALINASYMTDTALGVRDGQYKDDTVEKASRVMKLLLKLKKTGFKGSIMSECARKFYDPNFEEKIDSNRKLIGFNNGIYDLDNGCFRKGSPDDFVSMSVGYDYIEYPDNHPYIIGIKDFFAKVQRADDMREYVLSLLSSYLDGDTTHQQFIIWTGSGSNGKSTVVEFFQLAFGDYCGVLPITVLTKKRASSGSATPEMAEMRGKRFVVFQEPESDDQIYVGYMKELTGGDYIYARPLFKDPIRFKPQFKLLLTCNKLPHIPSTDGGTWRRLRVSPWETEFVDDEPMFAHQFKKDYELNKKLELWKGAFMYYLLKIFYKQYLQNGRKLKEPPKVLEHTVKYKKDSDVFFGFINDQLVQTKSNKDYVPIDTLFRMFKEWYSTSFSNKCPMQKKDLNDYLLNNKYVCKSSYVYGVKYKEIAEAEELEDAGDKSGLDQ